MIVNADVIRISIHWACDVFKVTTFYTVCWSSKFSAAGRLCDDRSEICHGLIQVDVHLWIPDPLRCSGEI